MDRTIITTKTAALYDDLFDRFDTEDFEFAVAESEKYYALPLEHVRNKRCLDAGCGSGAFAARLLRAGAAEVHAVDIGEKNRENTLHWNAADRQRLTVVNNSVADLDYPDGYFDFVHSNGVVHHTKNPERSFRELVRVTKPGGLTVIGVYGRGGLMPFTIGRLRKIAPWLPYRLVSAATAAVFSKPYDQFLVLDFLYVPIVNRYREEDIRRWYSNVHYENVRRVTTHARYRYGSFTARIMHGEGYITMQGGKPR